MPRGKKTVSNFAPEMLQLFQRGAQSPIDIDFNDVKEAHAFAYRMNRLRQAMRDERHHMLSSAEGCQISIDKERAIVTVKPADTLYLDRVKAALAKLPELPAQVSIHAGLPSSVNMLEDELPKSRAELLAEEEARSKASQHVADFFKKGNEE